MSFPLLPDIYDEPFADSSQIPTYLVSRFAREQVTVALSGDGGDELFGGYNRYFATARLWSKLKRVPAAGAAAAAGAAGLVPPRPGTGMAGPAGRARPPPHFGARCSKALRVIAGARGLDDVYRSIPRRMGRGRSPVLGGDGGRAMPSTSTSVAGAPDALRMMYCDAVSYLPDDILCKVDRASMAVSLETRVPFLDHRVAEVAARIPLAMKIAAGGGKHILRELLYREAPAGTVRSAQGRLRNPGRRMDQGPAAGLGGRIARPRADCGRRAGSMPPLVAGRWQQHLVRRRDSTPALWAILMFQAWQRERNSVAAAAA